MTHAETLRFLSATALLLATALGFGELLRRRGLPAVTGEILGGILLGPTVLGMLAPAIEGWLFPIDGAVATARDALSRLGLIAFVFTAGLEVDLAQVRRRSRAVVATSLLGMLVPFALGWLGAEVARSGWRGGNPAHLPLFFGTALSISALPVIARMLQDLGIARTRAASVVLAAATIDDLVGWSLFAWILAGASAASAVSPWRGIALGAMLVGLALAARPLLAQVHAWLRQRLEVPGLLATAAVLVLGAAAAAEAAGLHALFGAFLAGLALSRGRTEREHAPDPSHAIALGVLAPLYFVTIGLRADLRNDFDLGLSAAILGLACAGKLVGATLGALAGGLDRRESLAVGFAMNARGAMEMVLASVALERGLIDRRLFVALVAMAVLTSVLAGLALARLLPRPASGIRTEADPQPNPEAAP